MSEQRALTDSRRMASLLFAVQWTIRFETRSPRRLANGRLSPSYGVTERGILWKCSQGMTCFNLSCHFQYCLSLRSLSRKDGAMFKHHPLPSCKFLYCFYSLSQAGESQTESEILLSLYDSFVEHRNNTTIIHLRGYILVQIHKLLYFLWSRTGISPAHLSCTGLTMEILFQSRFLLNMKHNAIQTQIPIPIL